MEIKTIFGITLGVIFISYGVFHLYKMFIDWKNTKSNKGE